MAQADELRDEGLNMWHGGCISSTAKSLHLLISGATRDG